MAHCCRGVFALRACWASRDSEVVGRAQRLLGGGLRSISPEPSLAPTAARPLRWIEGRGRLWAGGLGPGDSYAGYDGEVVGGAA